MVRKRTFLFCVELSGHISGWGQTIAFSIYQTFIREGQIWAGDKRAGHASAVCAFCMSLNWAYLGTGLGGFQIQAFFSGFPDRSVDRVIWSFHIGILPHCQHPRRVTIKVSGALMHTNAPTISPLTPDLLKRKKKFCFVLIYKFVALGNRGNFWGWNNKARNCSCEQGNAPNMHFLFVLCYIISRLITATWSPQGSLQ